MALASTSAGRPKEKEKAADILAKQKWKSGSRVKKTLSFSYLLAEFTLSPFIFFFHVSQLQTAGKHGHGISDVTHTLVAGRLSFGFISNYFVSYLEQENPSVGGTEAGWGSGVMLGDKSFILNDKTHCLLRRVFWSDALNDRLLFSRNEK